MCLFLFLQIGVTVCVCCVCVYMWEGEGGICSKCVIEQIRVFFNATVWFIPTFSKWWMASQISP